MPNLPSGRARRGLAGAVGILALATLAALVWLWPSGPVRGTANGPHATLVDATVTSVDQVDCPGSHEACLLVEVRLANGPEGGQTTALSPRSFGAHGPRVAVGDGVVLDRVTDPSGRATYELADFQRRIPLVVLAALFAMAVVGVARWRGAAALAGIVLTWVALAEFVVPAILHGESPVSVAVAGTAAIALVVLYLAHGVSWRTSSAVVATLATLAVTAALAAVFVGVAHLSGLASDEATYLQTIAGNVNLSGLVLAGMVIGSVGVLNDVTVSQVATVWELHRADGTLRPRSLFAAGMRVGRDHIASTVYTLVLAYAGAALPLVLVITLAQQGLGRAVTSEVVATELIRAMVGSIGLALSVPLSTALAAVTVTGIDEGGTATVRDGRGSQMIEVAPPE
jgi:uncharacterized membrane protein